MKTRGPGFRGERSYGRTRLCSGRIRQRKSRVAKRKRRAVERKEGGTYLTTKSKITRNQEENATLEVDRGAGPIGRAPVTLWLLKVNF